MEALVIFAQCMAVLAGFVMAVTFYGLLAASVIHNKW